MRENVKIISNNKKAYFDYFIEEKLEAGIELHGTEVKSVRMGKCSVKEAYIGINNGEMFIYNMNISPYEKGNIFKKLLLHKAQISKWAGASNAAGYTIVPLNVHLSGGRVKLDIGLARGKKLYDKRQSIARKDQEREARRDYKIKCK